MWTTPSRLAAGVQGRRALRAPQRLLLYVELEQVEVVDVLHGQRAGGQLRPPCSAPRPSLTRGAAAAAARELAAGRDAPSRGRGKRRARGRSRGAHPSGRGRRPSLCLGTRRRAGESRACLRRPRARGCVAAPGPGRAGSGWRSERGARLGGGGAGQAPAARSLALLLLGSLDRNRSQPGGAAVRDPAPLLRAALLPDVTGARGPGQPTRWPMAARGPAAEAAQGGARLTAPPPPSQLTGGASSRRAAEGLAEG